jgi:hypothetical protein
LDWGWSFSPEYARVLERYLARLALGRKKQSSLRVKILSGRELND